MEGVFVTIDYDDVLPDPKAAFNFIDRMINYEYKRVAIYISDPTKQTEIENRLIDLHKPMLTYITVKAVIVTNSFPKSVAYISSRAIRFTNWADIERYFI